MAKKPTKAQINAALVAIVAAGADGTFTQPDIHGPLVTEGLVEINAGVTNENGVATRATQKGIDMVNNSTKAPQAQAPKPSYELQQAALPPITGRGRSSGSEYPFDQMEVGQSFFVAASADRPEPGKSLASTVSAATKRYAEETGETKTTPKGNVIPVLKETRKFVLRTRTKEAEAAEGFTHGNDGARIYRVQ